MLLNWREYDNPHPHPGGNLTMAGNIFDCHDLMGSASRVKGIGCR